MALLRMVAPLTKRDVPMPDYVLQQIVSKAKFARDGGFNVLSKGEKLAVALALNREDWLADMNYTIAEAVERVGHEWMARVPEAARILEGEDRYNQGMF